MADAEPKVAVTIRKTPGVCGGDACIGNTRIPVWLVVSFRQRGLSEEKLLQSYPQLTVAHLRLAWDYYQSHRAEIDHDIEEQDEEAFR